MIILRIKKAVQEFEYRREAFLPPGRKASRHTSRVYYCFNSLLLVVLRIGGAGPTLPFHMIIDE